MSEATASTNPPPPVSTVSQPLQKKIPIERILVWFLFLVSGACGLIYEVLWCRQLGLLFGNTAHSPFSRAYCIYVRPGARQLRSRGGSVTAFNGRCSFTACLSC